MKAMLILIGTIGVILWQPAVGLGNIIHVPGDAATIQAGITAAVSGDTVLVANGTYTGTGNKDLDFSSIAITVRSAHGAGNCVIDCQGSGRGFFFHGGETASAVVDGFTIRHGSISAGPGGGIYCTAHSSPTIANCTISQNTGYAGGGIFCETSSSPAVTDCTISGNTASGYGGGILCSSSSPTVTHCTISGNTASNGGGGIYCASSSTTIINCTISLNIANSGSAGGGIYCSSTPSPSVANCTISGNSASAGSGIYCLSSSPSVINCTISGNTATGGGGGIYFYSSASPSVTNCTIARNTAIGSGGGIYCSSSSMTVTNCIMWLDVPTEISTTLRTAVVSHCDVQGGWSGTANLNCNPGFVSASDYHLTAGSCCINVGASAGAPADDIDGDARPQGVGFDIGSDEYVPPVPATTPVGVATALLILSGLLVASSLKRAGNR